MKTKLMAAATAFTLVLSGSAAQAAMSSRSRRMRGP